MQILEIILYGDSDLIRRVPFKTGRVNIITGGSATGKSALSHIVEYALGRTEFLIPEGPISQSVRWYALILQFADTQMFVAHKAPATSQKTTTDMYFAIGDEVAVPMQEELVANVTPNDLSQYISRLLGIAPNLHTPAEGQTRRPLEATLRHALFYCFQTQTEIAKNNLIFHRADEDYLPQSIKDTLPYFLGAVDEDLLMKTQELRRLRRDLALAERRMLESQAVQGTTTDRGPALLTEAQTVGLLEVAEPTDDIQAIRALLQGATTWTPQQPSAAPTDDSLVPLQAEYSRLSDELRHCNERIVATRQFESGSKGFTVEAQEHRARLEFVNIYPNAAEDAGLTCPMCNSALEHPTPSAQNMSESLARIVSQLTQVATEQPRLAELIDEEERQASELRLQISEVNRRMRAIAAVRPQTNQLLTVNAEISRVVGRISLYLESLHDLVIAEEAIPQGDQTALLALRTRVAELETAISEATTEDLLTSILNIVNRYIGANAAALSIEYSNDPIRLDINRLTIVADDPIAGPVPFVRMGSAENWIGYHLAVYLALHKWFAQRNRPVPRFLFLDQPTQAFYPQDQDQNGSLDVIPGSDRDKVRRMFKWLIDTVDAMSPNIQVIITDHADLTDDWFQDHVTERWRGDDKLIPQDWLSE